MLAGAIGRVEEHGRGRRLAAERTVVAHIGPQPTGARLQVAARRLGAGEALHLDAGSFHLGSILGRCSGQFLELQLHLIEQALGALGARAEQLALHLRDQELQMFDQCLGAGELGARLDQRGLERIGVIGKRIGYRRHATTESQDLPIRRSYSPA
jgi:hypothetical protein